MSQAERDQYAASKPCPECGLPIAACNEIALQRMEIKRLRAALSWVEDQDPQIVDAARTKFELA